MSDTGTAPCSADEHTQPSGAASSTHLHANGPDMCAAGAQPAVGGWAVGSDQWSAVDRLQPAAAGDAPGQTLQGSGANPSDDQDDVFDFDPGFQEDPNQPLTESDIDDEDDDVGSINDGSFAESDPSRSVGSAIFSTSVPINVPQWSAMRPALQQQRGEVPGENMAPEDMAASIQALARSVHADSAMVFGELPKSRTRASRTLSTQSSVGGDARASHTLSTQSSVGGDFNDAELE